jgi:ankyrin repeat protein
MPPLHHAVGYVAAYRGKKELVDTLLALGASTEIKNCDGRTARMMAENAGHKEVVRALQRPGASSR